MLLITRMVAFSFSLSLYAFFFMAPMAPLRAPAGRKCPPAAGPDGSNCPVSLNTVPLGSLVGLTFAVCQDSETGSPDAWE